MDKIKITLTSGSVMEKPLISAFKGSAAIYVVLDNEMNGTAGLPIILVSKLNGNRLEVITDANEWNIVKEYLRNIAAGNQMDYVMIPQELTGDDVFYKQLTLQVQSFEAMKSAYKPIGDTATVLGSVTPEVQPIPAQNVAPTPSPVGEPTPVAPEVVQPSAPTPVMPVETPVTPQPMPTPQPTQTVAPVTPTPAVMPNPELMVTPIEQPAPTPGAPVAPVMPEAPVAPAVEPIPTPVNQTIDFSADKEAFLKACENMFDALVAKFNK